MKTDRDYSKKIKKIKKELNKKRVKPQRFIFRKIMFGLTSFLLLVFILIVIAYFGRTTLNMALNEQRMMKNEVELVILGVEALLQTYEQELKDVTVSELPQWLKEKGIEEFPIIKPDINIEPDGIKEI